MPILGVSGGERPRGAVSSQEVRANCTWADTGFLECLSDWSRTSDSLGEGGSSAAGLQPSGCLGPPVMVRVSPSCWASGWAWHNLACHHPPRSRSIQVWSEWVLVCLFYTDSFTTASRVSKHIPCVKMTDTLVLFQASSYSFYIGLGPGRQSVSGSHGVLFCPFLISF